MKTRGREIFLILTSFAVFSKQSTPCGFRQSLGSGDIVDANMSAPDPFDTDVTILMANAMGTVQCCGVVLGWEMFLEGIGVIHLQIWRPVPGKVNKYMLLGENTIGHKVAEVTRTGRVIPNRNYIHVVAGDILGFTQSYGATLRHTTCDPALPTDPDICADDLLVNKASRPVAGEKLKFTTEQSSYLHTNTVKGYAVAAFLNEKDPVTCSNKRVTIVDTLNMGDHVVSVNAKNMDMYHPNSSFAIETMSKYIPVTIGAHTGEITVSDKLTPVYPSEEYSVTVRVKDVCSSVTSTCTITITVENVPKPIILVGLPASVELFDSESGSEVFAFSVSEQREVDKVTCYIRSALPNSGAYEISQNSKTEFGIYLNDVSEIFIGPEDDDVDVTVLLIGCEHSGGKYNQSTLTVTVRQRDGRDGTLLLILVLVLTIVTVVMVTILIACLSYKGKVKVWPREDFGGKIDRKLQTMEHKQNDTITVTRSIDRHASENGVSRFHPHVPLWDNFNSFYKIDKSITSGGLYGGLDNRLTKSNKTISTPQSDV